jgi:5-aminolevulinate synthase
MEWCRPRQGEFAAAGLPVMPSDTHIVPEFVGEPDRCKQATSCSSSTASTSSWLRITPSPYHDDALINALAHALTDVWKRLGLPLKPSALAAE